MAQKFTTIVKQGDGDGVPALKCLSLEATLSDSVYDPLAGLWPLPNSKGTWEM